MKSCLKVNQKSVAFAPVSDKTKGGERKMLFDRRTDFLRVPIPEQTKRYQGGSEMKLYITKAKKTIEFLLAVLFLASSVPAAAIPTPAAPQVSIRGEAGQSEACYWIVAEDAHGQITDVSPPAHVTNLPNQLDDQNYAEIRIQPVEGAIRYYVLKTTALPAPTEVQITVANPGKKTYYYWLVVCNGWRQSRLYGPYKAEHCDDPKGNRIRWTPVPNATWYHLFRTDTPQPPVGRFFFAVGLQLGMDPQIPDGLYGSSHRGTEFVDPGSLGYAVAGLPETPVTEPPVGEGNFLLAITQGEPVFDKGQPCKLFVATNINETERQPITMPTANTPSIRTFGMVDLKPRSFPRHLIRPSFIAHYSPFRIESVIEAGPHSDYQDTAGTPGWKSSVFDIETHQTSHAASQTFVLGGYQTNYGSGDTIYLTPVTTIYGSNNDTGDEGCYILRAHVERALNEYTDTLIQTSPRGSTRLYLANGNFNGAGSERLVVNLSQAYSEGRIVRVGNVDVHGKGTHWTKEMEGRWISFDVDTVKGHRMWYQIKSVESPTHLTIVARTSWSLACNLGYSRFIYDPETTDRPSPMYTNSHACHYLPPEHWQAAREGKYLICPGTLLGNPWKEGKTLNVEPLREEWKAGDQIQIVPGPQAYVYLARFMLFGDFLPQDDVGGILIANYGNRVTNWPAIEISHPGAEGFSEGIRISLPKSGAGDGLVIWASTGWDERGLPTGHSGVRNAAIVVPVNLPAMRGEFPTPYIQFKRPHNDPDNPSLQICSHQGGFPIASFTGQSAEFPRGIKIGATLHGSEQTRGKTTFSGDGTTRSFTVKFSVPFESEPFVLVSTNQFIPSRLATVAKDRFVVEFEYPPPAGQNNVTIYWMAQQ